MKNRCKETVFEATNPEFEDTGIARCIKCGHEIKITRVLIKEMMVKFKNEQNKKKVSN